jgi:hypothetical protein
MRANSAANGQACGINFDDAAGLTSRSLKDH